MRLSTTSEQKDDSYLGTKQLFFKWSFSFYSCTESGWDGVNFLWSSPYGAVFQIFVTKTVLITYQCFGYCWVMFAEHPGFFFFSALPSQWLDCRCPRNWEVAKSGQLRQGHWWKGYLMPYEAMLSNKSLGQRRRKKVFWPCSDLLKNSVSLTLNRHGR